MYLVPHACQSSPVDGELCTVCTAVRHAALPHHHHDAWAWTDEEHASAAPPQPWRSPHLLLRCGCMIAPCKASLLRLALWSVTGAAAAVMASSSATMGSSPTSEVRHTSRSAHSTAHIKPMRTPHARVSLRTHTVSVERECVLWRVHDGRVAAMASHSVAASSFQSWWSHWASRSAHATADVDTCASVRARTTCWSR